VLELADPLPEPLLELLELPQAARTIATAIAMRPTEADLNFVVIPLP
jgi:hypothetical protein